MKKFLNYLKTVINLTALSIIGAVPVTWIYLDGHQVVIDYKLRLYGTKVLFPMLLGVYTGSFIVVFVVATMFYFLFLKNFLKDLKKEIQLYKTERLRKTLDTI